MGKYPPAFHLYWQFQSKTYKPAVNNQKVMDFEDLNQAYSVQTNHESTYKGQLRKHEDRSRQSFGNWKKYMLAKCLASLLKVNRSSTNVSIHNDLEPHQ